MKKLTIILFAFLLLGASAYSADVTVNGKLVTWAGMSSNATDFDSDKSDSVGYLYINGEINTSVKLSDNVKVYLELELNDKVSNGAAINFPLTTNTVEIDEANVEITEFFTEAITVKIGHQYFEYTLRNNHRAMVLNDDFTAFKGTYKFEKGFLDIFYGKYFESFTSTNGSSDQDVYGIHFEWNFSENIHSIFYVNNATMDNAGTDKGNVTTIGAGVDYFLIDKKLELFFEIAAQFGAISETVDQGGLGLDAGAKWNFGALGSLKGLWIELNVGYRSGEDTDTDSSAFWNGMSSRTGSLIAEGNYVDDSPMYFGYANDRYLAVRGMVNADWNDKISSGFEIAYFGNTDEDADPYGIELHTSTTYNFSENLKMIAHLAIFLPDDGLAVDGDPVFAMAFETNVTF